MTEMNSLVKAIYSESSRLEQLISTKTLVNIYLINGIRLCGYILGFDAYTLLVKPDLSNVNNGQLIYKHAISTILPNNSP